MPARPSGLTKGRYHARLAETPADIKAAQALRYRCFVDAGGGGLDGDVFDAACHHMLIENRATGGLAGCFRLLPLEDGTHIGDSYSAQYYDLSGLRSFAGRMAELGRFCIAPEAQDADVLRIAWGAMTRFVDDEGVEMLFGCSSFQGTDESAYLDAFALLNDRHLAPKCWLPRIKAANVVRFARTQPAAPDRKLAQLGLPPLLRTYLLMGGWVSDHAVVDTDLNTLHVFTGLEIKSVPPARARLLRAVAG